MPWLLTSPGHQQPWYWLCRIGRFLSYWGRISSTCITSMWRNDTKCKFMSMFPLKHLARKGLINSENAATGKPPCLTRLDLNFNVLAVEALPFEEKEGYQSSMGSTGSNKTQMNTPTQPWYLPSEPCYLGLTMVENWHMCRSIPSKPHQTLNFSDPLCSCRFLTNRRVKLCTLVVLTNRMEREGEHNWYNPSFSSRIRRPSQNKQIMKMFL